jgi:hypothetical protein
MRIIRTIVMGTALAGAIATPALAQDFRFTVPVQVSKVPPNVKSLSVMCEAGQNGGPGIGFVVKATGTSALQQMNAGAFSGDVNVSVSAGTWEWQLVSQVRYECYVIFQATDAVSGVAFEYFRPVSNPPSQGGGAQAPTVPPAHMFPLATPPASVVMVSGVIPKP